MFCCFNLNNIADWSVRREQWRRTTKIRSPPFYLKALLGCLGMDKISQEHYSQHAETVFDLAAKRNLFVVLVFMM